MGRTRVRLDLSQFTAYRRDPSVQAAITAEAEHIAARANGMAASTHAGQPEYTAAPARDSRVGSIALASTGNLAARVDNAVHNTLARALGGG